MKNTNYILLTITVLLIITGCKQKNNADNSGLVKYNTQYPLSALEYTLITNKEIALVMNQLETHMSNGRSVIKGEYPIEDEIANAEHTLVMVREAIDSVDTLYPANGYEDDRLEILRRMENAYDSLENYREALDNNDMGLLEGLIAVMKADFTSLKAMFNNPWE